MVKIMEHPIKMDDLGGKPTIFGNTHIIFHNVVSKLKGVGYQSYCIPAGWDRQATHIHGDDCAGTAGSHAQGEDEWGRIDT